VSWDVCTGLANQSGQMMSSNVYCVYEPIKMRRLNPVFGMMPRIRPLENIFPELYSANSSFSSNLMSQYLQ